LLPPFVYYLLPPEKGKKKLEGVEGKGLLLARRSTPSSCSFPPFRVRRRKKEKEKKKRPEERGRKKGGRRKPGPTRGDITYVSPGRFAASGREGKKKSLARKDGG